MENLIRYKVNIDFNKYDFSDYEIIKIIGYIKLHGCDELFVEIGFYNKDNIYIEHEKPIYHYVDMVTDKIDYCYDYLKGIYNDRITRNILNINCLLKANISLQNKIKLL